MSYLSPTEADSRLRREVMENNSGGGSSEIAALQRQIDELNAQVNPVAPLPTTRQGINQMLRNSDLNHSVDTWFETTPTATDELHECANVYTYPAFDPIDISDAAITATDKTFTSASNPFTAAMVGRFVHIAGAGTAGEVLITFIASYTNAGSVELDSAAVTTVSGAEATINLLKLSHTNTKNTIATVNDTLKASTHSDIASNISDPDWDKTRGMARLGTTNVVAHTLGHFADNGTTYVPLHQLFPGREPFARLSVARSSQYVHSPGRFFIGIYNNNQDELDWVRAASFSVAGVVDGSPTGTVSTDYLVVIDTDLGYTLVSDVLTVADAPDDAGYAAGSRIRLRWQYFAATTQARFYRRRSGENVFLMESVANGVNSWTDVNRSTATDTGSTSFPTFSDSVNALPSYWSSPLDNFAELPVDGEPGVYWQAIEVFLPFPPTVDMRSVADPHLILGLTEPLSTLLSDGVVSGTTLTSAAGQFTAAMVGKSLDINYLSGGRITRTIAAYTDANTVTLNTSTTSGAELVVEIKDSQPHGMYFDLIGLALNEGEWDFHPDDNNRPQTVAANPNGSPQGGTGGGSPTGGGGTGGPVYCPEENQWVPVDDGDGNVIIKRACELTTNDRTYNPESGTFHRIKTAEMRRNQPICLVTTEAGASASSSPSHPIITSELDGAGVAVGHLRKGNTARVWSRKNGVIWTDRVSGKRMLVRKGNVVFIELEDGYIYAYSDDGILFLLCHNAKETPGDLPPEF